MNATTTTRADQDSMTEAEFLDGQMADAQVAFQKTLADVKSTLREAATLDVWAKRHPWLVAGTAVTGGFLLATMLFPPKSESVAESDDHGESNGRSYAAQPTSRSSWLFNTLFNLLKPILGQLVSSLLAAAVGGAAGSMAGAGADSPDEDPVADSNMPPVGEGPVPL